MFVTYWDGIMPSDLSYSEVVGEIEVGKEHGLDEVSLLDNLNMIAFVKSLNLISQITHYVRLFCNLFQSVNETKR